MNEPGRPSPVRRLRTRFRPRNRPRLTGPSFNQMIPNILTMLGLCAGLTSMRFALEGRFGAAAVAVVIAGCIDGIDGRLARLLKATSRFGAEFDSLADFVCFGVAPAFILYLWSLRDFGGFGFTPNAMAVAPIVTAAKKPMIIMNTAATSVITTMSPFIARMSFTLPQVTQPLAEWAAKNGIRTVYTIVTDFGPGVDAEKMFFEPSACSNGRIQNSDASVWTLGLPK